MRAIPATCPGTRIRHTGGLSHPDVVTAWMALSVSIVENGCMRVIPATHLDGSAAAQGHVRREQPAEPRPGGSRSGERGRRGRTSSCSRASSRCTTCGSCTVPDPNRADYSASRLCGPAHPDAMSSRRSDRATAPPWCAAWTTTIISTWSPRPKADLDPEAVALHARVTEEANKILYRGTDKRNPEVTAPGRGMPELR